SSTTCTKKLCTCNPSLYSINPNLRNRFMKKLTREGVVPTMEASVSWLIFGVTLSGFPSFPKFANSGRTRANRFSLELNSWSTKLSSIRILRESKWARNNSEKGRLLLEYLKGKRFSQLDDHTNRIVRQR